MPLPLLFIHYNRCIASSAQPSSSQLFAAPLLLLRSSCPLGARRGQGLRWVLLVGASPWVSRLLAALRSAEQRAAGVTCASVPVWRREDPAACWVGRECVLLAVSWRHTWGGGGVQARCLPLCARLTAELTHLPLMQLTWLPARTWVDRVGVGDTGGCGLIGPTGPRGGGTGISHST